MVASGGEVDAVDDEVAVAGGGGEGAEGGVEGLGPEGGADFGGEEVDGGTEPVVVGEAVAEGLHEFGFGLSAEEGGELLGAGGVVFVGGVVEVGEAGVEQVFFERGVVVEDGVAGVVTEVLGEEVGEEDGVGGDFGADDGADGELGEHVVGEFGGCAVHKGGIERDGSGNGGEGGGEALEEGAMFGEDKGPEEGEEEEGGSGARAKRA